MAIANLFQIADVFRHSRRKVTIISMVTLAQFASLSLGFPASLESHAHGGFSENPMTGELDHLHPQPLILSALKSLNPSDYSIFIEAIQGVDLENRAGTLTLFALSDEAFKVITKKTFQCMQSHAGKMLMRSMISYHSVFGNFPASSLTEDTELQSYAGFMLPISVNSSGTFVGAQHPFSKLTHPNLVVAAGGAVHGIDSILAQPLLYLEVEAIEVCEKHHYSSSINAELL